ncbi:MAG: hypothetical protein F6K55_01225 [Moorea sp. SIO4A3]|nr:hypothetical protein [Moorena sp. SIO4A3]
MNIKRIFGTLVAFVFTVAVVFGLQVGSASAAPDASLSELSQGGTLIADIPGYQHFEYNRPYFLFKGQTLTITDTPENLVLMVSENDSPSYSGTLILTYGQESEVLRFLPNDGEAKITIFNPKGSRLKVSNFSNSPSSRVSFTFQSV